MKSINKIKMIFSSLLFPAYFSLVIIGFQENIFLNNTNLNSIKNVDNNLDATTSYSHTNYATNNFSESSFSNFTLFGQTKMSMIVQIDTGVVSVSSDMKTIMLTSYSGVIVWSQQLTTNELIKSYCTANSFDINNLKIREWVYLTNDPSKNWLALLVSDNAKEAIVTLHLDSGLFVPDNTNNDLVLNGDSAFVKISDDNTYDRVFQIGIGSFLVMNTSDNAKLITYGSNNVTVSDVTISYSNLSTRRIASFVYADSQAYAYVISKTGTNSNSKISFSQYLVSVQLNGSTLTLSSETKLKNTYDVSTTNANDTMLTDLSDFKSTFFYDKGSSETKIFLLSGSIGNNSIEVYKFTNRQSTLTNVANISLADSTVNSVTYSSNFNKLYIGNASTTGNVYLSWIDTNSNSPKLETIQQYIGTPTTKNYFLVPVLGNKNTEYLIQTSVDSTNEPIYMVYSNESYSNATSKMSLKKWSLTSGKDIYNLGQSYTPDGVTLDVVRSYLTFTSFTPTLTQGTVIKDTNNGTIKYNLKVNYPSTYDSSFTDTFNITFYINNLTKSNAYSFTWIDSTTAETETNKTKVETIKNLKANNYATKVTSKDIIDNFIDYTILDRSGNSISITQDMISLSTSNNYSSLIVTIKLPSDKLPIGTSSDKITLTKTYNDFLSTTSYKVSKKSDNDIATFTKRIYPSKLTNGDIITNFVTVSGLTNTVSDWDITITNRDDYAGTVTIKATYKNAESQVKNKDQLPTSYFDGFKNIINNQMFVGFKSLSSQALISTKPTMTDLTSTISQNKYLPSEIWNQYIEYESGEDPSIKKTDVILLNNLSFNLTSIDNLVIDKSSVKVVDSEVGYSSTNYSQGYIEFNATIKNGSETNIEYDGSEFQTNGGKLVVNEALLKNMEYPYKIRWNINTYNKYFILQDKNGNVIQSSDSNIYAIDLQNTNSNFTNINKNLYSSSISVNDIEKLINTKGYNYSISLNQNLEKGYLKATISLSLQDKPLTSDENFSNNPNFTKIIYIYNFKVPMSMSILLLIAFSIALGCTVFVLLTILHVKWIWKKVQYNKLSKNFNDVKSNQKKQKNASKKKRYFKK